MMLHRIRAIVRRPSPATVIAVAALVVAASGAAVAAIPDGSGVVTACLKENHLPIVEEQIRIIDAEAGETCDSRETALRLASTDGSGKVADADRLDGMDSGDFLGATGKAADSDLLDGTDSSAFAKRRWAIVRADGTLARSSGGVRTGRIGNGTYFVDFPGGAHQCAFTASLGHHNNFQPDDSPGFVVARQATPEDVFVSTYASSGSPANRGFHLAAHC